MTNQLCRHSLRSAAAILAVFVFSVVDNYAAAGPGQGGGGWSPSQISGQGIVVHPLGNTLEVRSFANGNGILWDFPDGIGGNPSSRINGNTNDFVFTGGILSLNSNRTESVRAFTNINFMYLFQTNTPATPDPGHTVYYSKSDGNIYKLSSDGIEVMLSGGGGGGGGSTSDSVYGPAWNGVTTTSPSQNSVFDKIETIGTNLVSNATFGPGWQGKTNQAASQDALYAKMTNFVTATNTTWSGDRRILRSAGTTNGIQSSVVQLDDNGFFNFPSGVRQTFAPTTLTPGINVGVLNSVQPANAINGDLWYHSGASVIKGFAGNQNFAISMHESMMPTLTAFKAGSPAAVFSAAEDTDRWLFNDTTDQFIQMQSMMGASFGNLAWGMMITFAMSTGNTGSVVWGAQVMASNGGVAEDNAVPSYAAANLATAAAAPTTVGGIQQASLSFSNHDSPNVNSLIKLRIFRDADHASDNAPGDAELLAVRITWVRTQ